MSLRTIVITGASGGIGAELAKAWAKPRTRLALSGRDAARLAEVAAACGARGAVVETRTLDVRDRVALHGWLAAVEAGGPIDILVANAGVSAGLGPQRSRESDADVRRLVEVNMLATIDTVNGAVEPMRARGGGRIVIVASVAGIRGYPDMPTYSATKAGLIAYGDAVRGWLRPAGVTVTVVCPGFVTSPMSARHRGAKPFEIGADRAAAIVVRAAENRRPRVDFPFLFALGAHLTRLMPAALADFFMRPFAARVEPDPRGGIDPPRRDPPGGAGG
jgi:short-subunit dehydrogenase